jgi:hypothetical protein
MKNSIRDRIRSERIRDRELLFVAGLRQKLVKEGKLRVNQHEIYRVAREFAP